MLMWPSRVLRSRFRGVSLIALMHRPSYVDAIARDTETTWVYESVNTPCHRCISQTSRFDECQSGEKLPPQRSLFAAIKAIQFVPVRASCGRTDTDVGPLILDRIRFVVTGRDIHRDNIGVTDRQGTGREGRGRFAVRMHDIGEPICQLLQPTADYFGAVGYADRAGGRPLNLQRR